MALTEAPAQFRDEFGKQLKDGLRAISGVVVLDFMGVIDGDDIQVFEHDRRCTLEADLCLFVADHPSIGLGMEIGFRYIQNQPMVVFARAEKRVTRMLTGALRLRDESVQRYDTVEDIVAAVRNMLPQ